MFGHDVRVLQDFLSRVGVQTSVDGQYGRMTRRSVRRWESKSSLRSNGRMSRRDEAILRGQVKDGENVMNLGSDGGASTPAPVAPAGPKAILTTDGHAIAPAAAPPAVKAVIAAANHIVGKPYKYGGGHAQWNDTGYDCSGSDSYALHGGGLLKQPMTSGEFESYGAAGSGAWITIYGSGGHSYMVVAGLRFDTGWHPGPSGPQWSAKMRPSDGYVARHPVGY
jgi:putative peptidoglycan binding protein